MALQQDLFVNQGTDKKMRFWVTDQDTGQIVDLTNYTAEMFVRRESEDGKIIIQLVIGDGLSIVPLDGLIQVDLTPADTEDLRFEGEELECYYDLKMKNNTSEQVDRVSEGTFTINKAVTRSGTVNR
jgi:hypothetical protein